MPKAKGFPSSSPGARAISSICRATSRPWTAAKVSRGSPLPGVANEDDVPVSRLKRTCG